MPIHHKFLEKNWANGFQTRNAILEVTPNYKPEVLFVGTYNPDTDGPHNLATFFYGRDNYLFPLLHGIFNLQKPQMQSPPYDDIIWPLCAKLKLSFADLVTCVFHDTDVHLIPNSNRVVYDGEEYNLISDEALKKIQVKHEGLLWNTMIGKFIDEKESIKYVYLTQKSPGIFLDRFQSIKNSCKRKDVSFRCIHTPSGQRIPGSPKELFLAFQWLVEQGNQIGFDLQWLHSHGVHKLDFGNYKLNF